MTLFIAFLLLEQGDYSWWWYAAAILAWFCHITYHPTKTDVYNSFVEFANNVEKERRR